MKQKKGFNLRNVCGEQIIVAEGKENIDFSNIISMNESSAYLWQKLEGKEQWLQLQEQLLQEHQLVGTEHQLAAFRQPWQQQY